MTAPLLSIAASGYEGRGYADIFGGGGVLPSITTVTGALPKGAGLERWSRQQVAAYAVTHVDELISRSEEVGYKYLMAVPKVLTPEKADSLPSVWNASEYVLDDLSNTGTWIHQYIEDDLLGRFTAEPMRDDHAEMTEAWHQWRAQHDIEVIATEQTVFGEGFAGTADLFAKIDGVTYCVDHKSSRAVRESHVAQLGAIGAAHTTAQQVPEGTPGAVYHQIQPKIAEENGVSRNSWWVPGTLPAFEAYGVLQIRPADLTDRGEYIEPFVKLHQIPYTRIEAGYELFRAGLAVRMAQRNYKNIEKEETT